MAAVLLFVLFSWTGYLENEKYMWRMAEIENMYWNGNVKEATERLDELSDSDREQLLTLQHELEWNDELGNYERAAAASDRLAKRLSEVNPAQLDDLRLVVVRANALYGAKRSEDALKIWSDYISRNPGDPQSNSLTFNGYAYMCALTGKNLAEAEKIMNVILEEQAAAAVIHRQRAAYLYIKLNDRKSALEIVERLEAPQIASLESYEAVFKRDTAKLFENAEISKTDATAKLSEMREERDRRKKSLARTWVLKVLAIEDPVQAAKLRSDLGGRIESFGFKLESIERDFADEDSTLVAGQLQNIGNTLDTRAWIRFQNGKYNEARADLEIAVDLCDAALKYFDHYIETSPDVRASLEIRPQLRDLKASHRGLAVILYHRAETYKALKQDLLREFDEGRIRELGYQPGPQLF